MTDTPRTGLEFVDAGTTDIDQPVNNNALALDAVVGMNVVSATTTAEPTLTSPTDDGKVYILPAGKTGTNWAARANGDIAQWYSGTWYFYTPWAGLRARAADSGIIYQFTTAWAVWASVDGQLLLADTDAPRLGTDNSWSGAQTFAGALYETGIETVNLTANTDNLSINSTTRELRLTSTGAYNLTGVTGGASGRQLRIVNTSAFTITLTHDATSTAANRFFAPNNVDFSVRQNGACETSYDGTSSRWRVIGA